MILKFRAWNKFNSEMYDVQEIDFEEEMVLLPDNFGGTWEEFEDVELMQSTGLKDKNGVEIYEGDIVGSENKDSETWYVSHHKVIWHDTGFKGKQICSSSFIGLAHWTRGENGYVVIGNIYENSELLNLR